MNGVYGQRSFSSSTASKRSTQRARSIATSCRDRRAASVHRHASRTIYQSINRRRLGELIGGTEGAQLIEEADAVLRAGGVVDPARFTAALLPGIVIDDDPVSP
jgi:hypothetical protein